jgi:UDP-N-acetylglucosamine 2-epimerase (hydrolysing)
MNETKIRKVVFLTGTRADFGKMKSLMRKLQDDVEFEPSIFVTGMHMLSKYGYTCEEVEKAGFRNVYKYINQNSNDKMDHVLAKTISGLSDYVNEICPDLLIVHGDRVEALAGASVGALNNILVGHIEGGEVSGTVDELIRHAVTKLSHIHFVANDSAKVRLAQLGERENVIHVIGSPDIDVMNSDSLPPMHRVQEHYGFDFSTYGILMFHPVTSDLGNLQRHIGTVVDQVIATGDNFIVIYPNNDQGTDVILKEYSRLETLPNVRIYPSMRFEYFLTLLKNASFILGNSSAGVREAPHFGVPAINLGSRQCNRVSCDSVIDADIEPSAISGALRRVRGISRRPRSLFGSGKSAERFHTIIKCPTFWQQQTQKYFMDRALK